MYKKIRAIQELLSASSNKVLSDEEAISAASQLAHEIMQLATMLATNKEIRRFARINLMIHHPEDKIFALKFTDRFFRPVFASRSIELFYDLMSKNPPTFLSKIERWGLSVISYFGKIVPKAVRCLLLFGIKRQIDQVVSRDSPKNISKLIRTHQADNLHVNLNRLGEAILGEAEALQRLNSYIKDCQIPGLEMISVKISSLYSQINLTAFNESLNVLQVRLKTLLRAAQDHSICIMLDMEEWKDLELTSALLQTTLDDPEFLHARAGIALQAYIPYSSTLLEKLIEWTKERVSRGGYPIRIRLVKGANLPMERLESSLKNWPQAPFKKKEDTDAHFIYMLHRLLEKDTDEVIEVGIGSHNLFDLCYGAVIGASKNRLSRMYFETLSGMAPSLSLALAKIVPHSLLYCPVVADNEFYTALAYLTRRLDENTAPINFLASLAQLGADTVTWQNQQERFEHSVLERNTVYRKNRRDQNRNQIQIQSAEAPLSIEPEDFTSKIPTFTHSFQNTPDTDWSLPSNRKWGIDILQEWSAKSTYRIPLQIAGELIAGITSQSRIDPSRPDFVIHEHQLAGQNQLEKAIVTASQAALELSKETIQSKAQQLFIIANKLEDHRRDLIGSMIQEVAKSLSEADSEVSEAIDFARYYAHQLIEEATLFERATFTGIALVASPWNFPCSIPLNAIIAAYATNHSILFKPAPEAIGVGFILAKILWEAGISQEVLQFIPTRDDPEGYLLLQDKRIDTVFLTGATETGKLFTKSCPTRRLFAETGGKNAIIVTQTADLDVAVKEIISSAFNYSGQKCSACSLVIIEKPLLHNSIFLSKLADAAKSLPVGSAWDPKAKITPLARPPSDAFMRGLQLDEGEKWLVTPFLDPENNLLYSPGIKMGVKPGSFTHTTEFFGPLLAILSAESLHDAIDIANQTPYGLTAGLISLDPKEQALFTKEIGAGNRYINRAITGAIVGRQPFGGMKGSSFGTGMKAGGPSFLIQLLDGKQTDQDNANKYKPITALANHKQLHLTSLLRPTGDNAQFVDISRSYAGAYATYFEKLKPLQTHFGQDNFLQYRGHEELFIYIHPSDTLRDIWKICSAATLLRTHLHMVGENLNLNAVCRVPDLATFCQDLGFRWHDHIDTFCHSFQNQIFPRFRACRAPPDSILHRIAPFAQSIEIRIPSEEGRVELVHFLQEISLSVDYHRWGNLQGRTGD